ncbi:MAG: exodeoxyribonuclease III [Gammaproteobacteria bacterium]|nr:exodeoxyribonuclease III [Gammaproteobacteria bacterium]
MRIATWNVNGLRARIDYLALWLKVRQPDIVGLQELKIEDAEFPTQVFTDLGYHVVTHGQKAWNGVAVLSRAPAQVVLRGLPGQDDFGARLLRVHVAGIDFTTVYCPNGKSLDHEDYPRKLAWFEALAAYWRDAPTLDHTVICGDFNIVPAAIDSWLDDTTDDIFHTPAERARFAALAELGLVDLYRAKHPERRAYSWWDYRGGAFHRGHGLRIDLLLANSALLQRVTAVEIDRDFRKKQDGLTASDHAPVYADLT